MNAIFIYLTVPTSKEAKKIVASLLAKKLIACANILPHMESFYRWKGKIEHANEVVVILKTRKTLFEKVKKDILENHSYENPCIVALAIEKGHQPFLQWIRQQT